MSKRNQCDSQGRWFMMVLMVWASISTAVTGTSYAQVVSASLSGRVTDPAGANVPGANMTATNIGTGSATTTETDVNGTYNFPLLAAGKYKLVSEKPGFKSAVLSGIELAVNQQGRLDVALELGEVTTLVEVDAVTPMVESTTANVGTVIGEMETVKLPLNLRRYGALAVLVPGTTPDNGGTAGNSAGSNFTETTYSANGARSSSNDYLIDGVSSRNLGAGGFALQPPPDAVQEFKIQTNAYSAVFGVTAGSTINLVTKSGTNNLHGSVYEFLRNDALDARNYFATNKGKLRRNQFGFAVGGPIRKNKTFWFANYEGLRESTATVPRLSTVPTATQKSGNLSAYLTGNTLNLCGAGGPANLNFDTGQLFDPGSLSLFSCPDGSAKAGSSILIGTPIPGNVITNIDPVAQKVLAGYPEPNRAGFLNFINTTPLRRNDDQFLGRIDHMFGAKDQLNGRYIFGESDLVQPFDYSPYTAFGRTFHYRGQNLGLTWTHTFGPNLLNEARFGFQRNWAIRNCNACPREEGFIKDFGIEGFQAVSPNFEAHPFFGISNFGSIGDAGYRPGTYPDMVEKYQDNVTWVHGRHTTVFGADLQFIQNLRIMAPASLNGSISYNGRFSSLAGQLPDTNLVRGLADLMMGYPAGGQRTLRFQPNNWVGQGLWNLYAQDDVKISPNLSLNLGLRYEFRRPPVDKRNSLLTFVPTGAPFSGPGNATLITAADDAQNDAYCTDPFYSYLNSSDGRCLVASSGLRSQLGFEGRTRRSLVYTYKKNWAPRIGLAWRPFQSDKFIIRTGYGIFYDFLPLENMIFVNNNPVTTPTQVYSTAFGSPPPLTNGVPTKVQQMFNRSGGVAPVGEQFLSLFVTPEYKTPYLQSWSFGISSQLTQDWALEVNYIGNKGTHNGILHLFANQPRPGVGSLQPRRPYPDYNIMLFSTTDGNSHYDSFQTKLTKRFSQGFTVLASYTMQKGINDGDGNEGFGGGGSQLNPQDDNNRTADRGRSYSDARQRLALSYVWHLPVGRGKRFLNREGLVNHVFGGWQASGITTFQSGFPFTVFSGQDFSNTDSLSPRPDRTCSGEGQRTLTSWFDTSCFNTVALQDALASGNPRFGNSGRSVLDGPGSIGWDVALLKEFAIGERFHLEFRAEAYSVLNHMNPGLPITDISNPFAGQILSGSGQRNLQFGLKLAF